MVAIAMIGMALLGLSLTVVLVLDVKTWGEEE